MGLGDIQYNDGQTPIDEDEKDGLLLPWVNTKQELDEAEQQNIENAIRWTVERRKRFTVEEVLSEEFTRALHKRMFGEVWAWAGYFRNTNKNIGIDKYSIGTELRVLLDDCRYWIDNSVFPPDEIAIRFSHKMVAIHCFSNGNGRHSRLLADIIIEKLLGGQIFAWGGNNLVKAGQLRAAYLDAIRRADRRDYDPLILFARLA